MSELIQPVIFLYGLWKTILCWDWCSIWNIMCVFTILPLNLVSLSYLAFCTVGFLVPSPPNIIFMLVLAEGTIQWTIQQIISKLCSWRGTIWVYRDKAMDSCIFIYFLVPASMWRNILLDRSNFFIIFSPQFNMISFQIFLYLFLLHCFVDIPAVLLPKFIFLFKTYVPQYIPYLLLLTFFLSWFSLIHKIIALTLLGD